MPSLLIADDQPVFRRGVVHILAGAAAGWGFAEAGTAAELFTALREREWDVLLLGMPLPGATGMDVLAGVRRIAPRVRVVVVSGSPETCQPVQAFRLGASGYLVRSVAVEDLVVALRRAADGARYVSPAAAELMAGSLAAPDEALPHERLSNREFEVFCALAAGRSVGEIARDLCRSVKTVSTFRARILHKLGMRSNAELTRYAIQHRLIEWKGGGAGSAAQDGFSSTA